MSSSSSLTQITSELSNLVDAIETSVKSIKSKNKPNKELLRGKKLFKFTYLKPALTVSKVEFTIEKDSWEHLIWPIQRNVVEPFPEYQKLLTSIPHIFPKFKNERLSYFAVKVIHLCLYDNMRGFHSKTNLIKAFLKDLKDELLLYKADFEITGVALKPKSIKISNSIQLHKITKKDMEEPIPIESFIRHRKHQQNSLVRLHVEYYAKRDYIEFHKWEMLLAILRLYKVCDVNRDSHRIISESTEDWLNYGEKRVWNDHWFNFGCVLTSSDIPKLRIFWKTMEKQIPDSFKVPFTQRDNVTIAYQRYMEAMSNPGDDEMRIAFGIAALEALFLNEKDELKYKLRMRVARILGIMGINPESVYNDIGIAYNVRSTFDHGDKLETKDILKIRETYKAKDERVLTLIILDYVRICIIATILSKLKKSSMIELVDRSWISDNKHSELRKALQKTTRLLDLQHYKPKYSLSPFNDADFSYIR